MRGISSNDRDKFKTSTPKHSIRPDFRDLESMEQTTEMYSGNDIDAATTYTSRTISSGPSSYQAMFGSRSRGQSYGSYNKSSRYGEITAVSVNETFAQMPGILSTRKEEKQELSVLNNRFATYIDKVRRLEAQNKTLQSRIVELESTKTTVSRSGDLYDDELGRLRREIEGLTHGKAEVDIQLHNCWQDLKEMEERLQREISGKADSERLIKSLRKDVDNATLVRIDLERKIETLMEELQLTKATNEEDIRSLQSHVTVKHEEVFDAPVSSSTDLTQSLREIRVAYESLSKNNNVDLEVVYKNTISDLQAQIKIMNGTHAECKSKLMETQRQLQMITVEIDGLRSTNSSLEGQLSDLHDRHESESEEYQKRISELESELQAARENMAHHLADYQRLMNLKLSLDLEIATYRQLLEGEEGRIRKVEASLDQSGYSIDKSVTVHTVTATKSITSPTILVKEEVRTRSRSSSSSSSSSESD